MTQAFHSLEAGSIQRKSIHFGARLNPVAATSLQTMPPETLQDVAAGLQSAGTDAFARIQAADDHKDSMTVTIEARGGEDYFAKLETRENGRCTVIKKQGETSFGDFLTEVANTTEAFAATLLTEEEKDARQVQLVTSFIEPLESGAVTLLTPTVTEKAGGSFMMHGGLYTQTVDIQAGQSTFTVTKAVSEGNKAELTFVETTANKPEKYTLNIDLNPTRNFTLKKQGDGNAPAEADIRAYANRGPEQRTEALAFIQRMITIHDKLSAAGAFPTPA